MKVNIKYIMLGVVMCECGERVRITNLTNHLISKHNESTKIDKHTNRKEENLKRYYKNRDKILLRMKNDYHKNKDKYLGKVDCECGSSISSVNYSQHKHSKKHIRYVLCKK